MRTTLAFLVALLAASLRAQTPYLVKDINAVRAASPSSSGPHDFFRYGSRIVFVATTPATGEELWVTDGTAAGTSQLIDIDPGPNSSRPSQFTIVNGTLIFNASDSRGNELWMSDGTSAGTRLLADIAGGSASSSPGDRIVFHGKMLFSALNSAELWITDGSPAGTRFFRNLGSAPRSFVQLGDTVYFTASDALWKTDGTEAGTVVVKSAVHATRLVVAGSRIFFTGYEPASGFEPWVSDGTEAGTRMLADISPGPNSSMSSGMTPLGDRVLFPAYEPQHGFEPWTSDGTPAGTRMVRDIFPGPTSSANFYSAVVMGGTAFFGATSPSAGYELWKSDGTEAGTLLVRDIRPGNGFSGLFGLTLAGNNIFFAASSDGTAATVWVTDGTENGTRAVNPAEPRPTINGTPAYFDGVLYFPGSNLLNGVELWKTDGTDAGTSMVLNIAQDAAPSSDPSHLTAAGEWLYFEAWDGFEGFPTSVESRSLWRTDGSPEGTIQLTKAPQHQSLFKAAGSSLFFSKDVLWTSDGTPEGTRRATELTSRFPASPSISFVLGDTLLVSAGGQLYATTLPPVAPAIPLGGTAYEFYGHAGRAFFLTYDPPAHALNITDGTPSGTLKVVSNLPDIPSGPIVSAGGHAYFNSYGGTSTKLWRTDGTYEGTVVVRALPGVAYNFVAAGRKLFFTIASRLWVSDGTEAGTYALPPTVYANAITTMAAAGERVIFAVNDPSTGPEPWVSDGTPEGTHLLRDINPGASGSGVSDFIGVDGAAYMTAFDTEHGSEVWVTDGTTEGTQLAADVEPGSAGSFPRQYVRAGNRLYFTATTTATGNELWSLAFPAEPRLTLQDVRVAEPDSGTTTVRFRVTLSAASTRSVTVDYATADGTAAAGSDYEAASGTLTFAAGETSKNIDVTVRGDAAAEGNETFFVTLRNAGAPVVKSSAFAIIEDNDRSADVALSLDFSLFDSSAVTVNAASRGPNTATNVRSLVTRTPAGVAASDGCCPTSVRDLVPGAAPVPALQYRWFEFQQYLTATASARERDPNPSNNRVEWTMTSTVAMEALSLTPGSQANVWAQVAFQLTTVNVESSDPAVVSVPASVAVPAGGRVVSFIARGLSVGSAVIRVFTPAGTYGTLKVDVVAPGTKLRWPGGVVPQRSESTIRFDKPALVRVYTPASAPYTGRPATGQITITANGRLSASAMLNPERSVLEVPLNVPYYAADIGKNSVKVEYSGDENFLPSTTSWEIDATRGNVTITELALRNGPSTTLRITVAGSPMASPSGTIKVSEAGVIAPVQATLVSAAPGVAQAEVTLQNVTGNTHTLLIEYSGDTQYLPATQSTRLLDPRTRSARH